MLIAAMAAAALAATAPTSWHCRNQYEVWCSATGCRLAPEGEFTPLDIWADRRGFSLCAYTGCWEGKGRARRIGGRLLWTGSDLPFSTQPDKPELRTDLTLLIFEEDGVGFVRGAGLATPLLCERAEKPEL